VTLWQTFWVPVYPGQGLFDMLQKKVQVLWNKQVCPSYYRIGLRCTGYADAKPGQFLMLRVANRSAALLSRPFSIHRLIAEEGRIEGIEVLYKVVGNRTAKLSRVQKGEHVSILGPLGNGFSISKAYHRIFIVAGGVGIAPLFFLVSSLRNRGVDLSESKVFVGGRTRDDLLCENDFSRLGIDVYTTTEDGSAGERGFVTKALEKAIAEKKPDIVYACGPFAMLKSVAGIAENYKVSCQVSIETMMACGIGACLGCAVERRDKPGKYWHVCTDVPVFDTSLLKM
jgi:dihydroorotate dehydrogenase electron transfer subunit